MTKQNVKQALENFQLSYKRAMLLLEEIQGINKSVWPLKDRYEDMVCKQSVEIEKIQENLELAYSNYFREINDILSQRNRVFTMLQCIDDNTLKLIVELKFIHGFTFEQIAEKTNYSLRQTFRLMDKALSIIESQTSGGIDANRERNH